MINSNHPWVERFQSEEDQFGEKLVGYLTDLFNSIQKFKREKNRAELQSKIIEMISILTSGLEHARKMQTKGIDLLKSKPSTTSDLCNILSSSLLLFFDFIDVYKTKQETFEVNETALRQIDQLLVENLKRLDIETAEVLDEDDFEEMELDDLDLPAWNKAKSSTFAKIGTF